MIWTNFIFDNQYLSNKTNDYEILIEEVDWKNINTKDENQKIKGSHWVKTSVSFADWRTIKIRWKILAYNEFWKWKAMQFLDRLFSLQDDTSKVEFKNFVLTDDNNQKWITKSKVRSPVFYQNEDNDFYSPLRSFNVNLYCEDPRLYSYEEKYIIWEEWNFGTALIPAKIPIKLNNYTYCQKIEVYSWNHPASTRIEIEVLNKIDKFLIIKNLCSWEFFKLQINANYGQKIIIDWFSHKVTLDWIDITWQRQPWSIFPRIYPNSSFVMYDEDWRYFWSDINFKIYYREILI